MWPSIFSVYMPISSSEILVEHLVCVIIVHTKVVHIIYKNRHFSEEIKQLNKNMRHIIKVVIVVAVIVVNYLEMKG